MKIVNIRFDKSKPWSPVRLPGSKSIAARALVCRYVYGTDTRLINLPECDDTRELSAALACLVEAAPNPLERIRRYGELVPRNLSFNLGNGGTSLRFFVALVASLPGLCCEIDCGESLRGRPLAPLINALRERGAEIYCTGVEGYAPLIVHGRRLRGGAGSTGASVSSQFLSAMMMASPLWETPLSYDIDGVVSRPYVEMTSRVMKDIAAAPSSYIIESDWSAASYLYELALAVPGREIIVESLTSPEVSMQGDSLCRDLFGWAGVETRRMDEDAHGAASICGNAEAIERMRGLGVPVALDLRSTPDIVPALASGLCLAHLPYDLGDIAHLRHKECDRLTALATELQRAGYAVADSDDSLVWNGRFMPVGDDETFDAWGDHRMAMSMAIMAVRRLYVAISGGEVVSKSWPSFYEALRHLGFVVSGIDCRIPS